MKQKLILLACVSLAFSGEAQVLISANPGNSYSQNFDSLANSGTANAWADNSTLPGWYASKSLNGTAIATYRADTGAGNAGALYSFGAASSTERALGSIGSGTPGNFAYGVRIQNDTSDTVRNIRVSYTGEQWRNGGNTSAQPLSFWYRTSSSPITSSDALTNDVWTSFSALDFTSPTVGATAVALDGNTTPNRVAFTEVALTDVVLEPGQEIFLRWVDLNDSGNDHALAIDDLTVTYDRAFVPPTGPAIVEQPQDATANVGTSASFSVASSGTPPLHYQWYKGGVAVADSATISGATNSTLEFSSVLHSNAGQYTVVISNSVNAVTSAPASLTVVGFAITAVDRTNTLSGVAVNVPLTFVDAQSPISSINATSGNQALLPDGNIQVTGSGNTRTLTLNPVSGANGVAVVTVSATDGNFTTNIAFPLMVVPANSVLLNDSFEYADGPLGANSANLWRNHGGTAGDLQVVSGMIYLSRSASEDVNAELIGQPYAADSGKKLYSKFTVNFSASDTPTSAGTYLAHFKDEEFGFRGRVWVSTNAAGAIRLGIGNGSDANKSSGEFPLDIAPGTTYTVVTRLNLADDSSTIWINPASESDQSVTATDAVTNGFINVTSYAFRQNSGMSKLFVDDLVVGTSFNAVMGSPEPDPITLNAARQGNNLILSWSDPSFVLQSASDVAGPYNPVSGATSPYTNSISGNQRFFRLQK